MSLDKSKFSKGPQPLAVTAGEPDEAPPGYRWEGIGNFGAKDPIPAIGTTVRVRVVSVVQGFNPGTKETSAKVSLRVISGSLPEGSGLFIPFMIGDPKAAGYEYEYARARLGAFVAGAGGFPSVAALVTFDKGACITGLLKGSGLLDGRVVDLAVTQGKAMKDGSGHFSEYVWTVVPDEADAQDQTPCLQSLIAT